MKKLEIDSEKAEHMLSNQLSLHDRYDSLIDLCKLNSLSNEETMKVFFLIKGIELFIVESKQYDKPHLI